MPRAAAASPAACRATLTTARAVSGRRFIRVQTTEDTENTEEEEEKRAEFCLLFFSSSVFSVSSVVSLLVAPGEGQPQHRPRQAQAQQRDRVERVRLALDAHRVGRRPPAGVVVPAQNHDAAL